MDVGATLVAHDQPPEAGHPREGSLRHPAVPSEAAAVLDALAGDARDDAAAAQGMADRAAGVGLVGVELPRPPSWPAAPSPLIPGTASSVASSISLSCQLAGLIVRPSGVPSASVTRWRFVPGLPRSVGLGPVVSPPFWRAPTCCRAPHGPTGCALPPPAGSARRGAVDPTPPPSANPAADASRSSPSRSPSRTAGAPTASSWSARTGCPSAPPGPAAAADRLPASPAPAAAAAPPQTTGHRARGASPCPSDASNRVPLDALMQACATGRGGRISSPEIRRTAPSAPGSDAIAMNPRDESHPCERWSEATMEPPFGEASGERGAPGSADGEVPGQGGCDAGDGVFCEAIQDIAEVGFGVAAVQARGGNEGCDGGALVAGEADVFRARRGDVTDASEPESEEGSRLPGRHGKGRKASPVARHGGLVRPYPVFSGRRVGGPVPPSRGRGPGS